jgi:hypothetical protein
MAQVKLCKSNSARGTFSVDFGLDVAVVLHLLLRLLRLLRTLTGSSGFAL